MGKWTDAAQVVRRSMDTAGGVLTDQQASEAVALYPMMRYDGKLIAAGTRIQWNGMLKRAAVDLWDTEENNPDNATALWEDIQYREGVRIIPEVITAGLAFEEGERGWWRDEIYESLIEANVWTPEQYPEKWKLIES